MNEGHLIVPKSALLKDSWDFLSLKTLWLLLKIKHKGQTEYYLIYLQIHQVQLNSDRVKVFSIMRSTPDQINTYLLFHPQLPSYVTSTLVVSTALNRNHSYLIFGMQLHLYQYYIPWWPRFHLIVTPSSHYFSYAFSKKNPLSQ